MKWVASDAERREALGEHPGAALVSNELPLRANLTALENIALVPQYRRDLEWDAAAGEAMGLLERLGCATCAGKRDAELTHAERFQVKLLRAVAAAPALVVIERPGYLLPDTHYPPFIDAALAALRDRFGDCTIIDYAWNAPLYPAR
jgi:predicted ABC-type transport system involved in lysophospholipase L1 biosynthesis ATPase subunit